MRERGRLRIEAAIFGRFRCVSCSPFGFLSDLVAAGCALPNYDVTCQKLHDLDVESTVASHIYQCPPIVPSLRQRLSNI